MSSLPETRSENCVVKELFVSSKTPIQEPGKMLAVFDFDHTIVNENSDVVARDLLPSEDVPKSSKTYSGKWTQYMQQVFCSLNNLGTSPEEIIDTVSNMCPIEGMPKLIRSLHENNFDVIIASDSNSLFINGWLKYNNLDDAVVCVYTNPAKIENGLINIEPFTLQTICKLCTTNMCKGNIVEEHKLKTNNIYTTIVYSGDGKNDFCPAVKLTKNDIVFPREGYELEKLLKTHAIQANVVSWSTGKCIYNYLKTRKLIL
ncbi:probable phosphatase phospho2 isoform X1 [Adelges cooleyi]|uniref:probable phosphatase phospho2 isoform X1 n=1 Tax=Adelges cooleyi TaxID=133065 RepID=UPI00217FC1EC|nr:probable phosphatase phospho2 isoform X1 [Adelges cooleyi]